MQFLERQIYMAENLLSYKTRVDSKELNDMLTFATRNLDAFDLTLTGNMILNVFDTISDENRRIYGIEVLLPVNRPFESRGRCIYKPQFRLENAVSSRFYSDYISLPEIREQVYSFLKEHNMQPVTDVYYVIRQHGGITAHNVFDAYIGINSNIV